MALSFETTHEYYIKDPTMFYCQEHHGLCISQDYEDTLRIAGVSDQAIIKFVNGLIKHYPELAASFEENPKVGKKTTSNKKPQSKTESTT